MYNLTGKGGLPVPACYLLARLSPKPLRSLVTETIHFRVEAAVLQRQCEEVLPPEQCFTGLPVFLLPGQASWSLKTPSTGVVLTSPAPVHREVQITDSSLERCCILPGGAG